MLSAGAWVGAAGCDGEEQKTEEPPMASQPVYGLPVEPEDSPPPAEEGMGTEPLAGSGGQMGGPGAAMPVYGLAVQPEPPSGVDAGVPDQSDEEEPSTTPVYGLAPTPEDE